jgi:hypothetical protein
MIKIYQNKLIGLVFVGVVLSTLPFGVQAVSQGETVSFNVESSYDVYSRNKVDAVLHRITNKIYFYIEKDWWESLDSDQKVLLDSKLYNLSTDFEYQIHPRMTSTFGPEPVHPVDTSGRLTVLFHRMPSSAGGYFNSGDQYSKYQYSRSNERNMIYVNVSFMNNPLLRGFLAHEFMHLITFNAKEKKHSVREEVWLNEARAEYMPTFFGYREEQENNTVRRKSSFINSPDNPLTEWLNRSEDYGSINMFVHYLVDHYGVKILADSLNSDKIGIESINYALKKNNYKEDFNQIFTDWTIAVLVNDCSLGNKYCYLNNDLKDLRIVPLTNYLPASHGGSFTSRRGVKNWSGNWYRVVGGRGDLKLGFQSEGNVFRVPYVLCDIKDSCEVKFIDLDSQGKGTIEVKDFDVKYSSLTIVPSAQGKITGFNGSEKTVFFSWSVETTTKKETTTSKEALTQELLFQISELQKEVARLQSLLLARGGTCLLTTDLSFGSKGDQVKCLQEKLKKDSVYPEGLITGNFLTLTRQAVVRFQEKYSSEILAPLGLSQGTGYVGLKTREKINQIAR